MLIMTMAQASALRVKWKRQAAPEKCEHMNLELELSEGGQRTGNYNCIICGEPVVRIASI